MNIPYEVALKGKEKIEEYILKENMKKQAEEKQLKMANEAHIILKRIHEVTDQYPFRERNNSGSDYNERFRLSYQPDKLWRIIQTLKNDLELLEQYTIDLIDNKNKYL